MQNVYISAGKALCRYCGEKISTNLLSTHITKVHARPTQSMAPTLVAKRAAVGPDPLK